MIRAAAIVGLALALCACAEPRPPPVNIDPGLAMAQACARKRAGTSEMTPAWLTWCTENGL